MQAATCWNKGSRPVHAYIDEWTKMGVSSVGYRTEKAAQYLNMLVMIYVIIHNVKSKVFHICTWSWFHCSKCHVSYNGDYLVVSLYIVKQL